MWSGVTARPLEGRSSCPRKSVHIKSAHMSEKIEAACVAAATIKLSVERVKLINATLLSKFGGVQVNLTNGFSFSFQL